MLGFVKKIILSCSESIESFVHDVHFFIVLLIFRLCLWSYCYYYYRLTVSFPWQPG